MIMATNAKKQQTAASLAKHDIPLKIVAYIICIILAALSLTPFIVMFVNATRGSSDISMNAFSFIPGKFLSRNWDTLTGKDFKPAVGFKNSFYVAACSTVLTLYFSTLTAYAIQAYTWKLKRPFFAFIMAVMMVPGQVTAIGFMQMIYKLHLTNTLEVLYLGAIAAPMLVFFMRQYMQASLSVEIIESARIDGANEFYTFNRIVLPIMKPAIATQGIFAFVNNWNQLFMPMVLLNDKTKYTLPIMVTLLRGDIYKTDFGSIYLGLSLTVIPLVVVYLILSRYIVEGVAMGSVKG